MPDAGEKNLGKLLSSVGRKLPTRWRVPRNLALIGIGTAIALLSAAAGVFAQKEEVPRRVREFVLRLMNETGDVRPVARTVIMTALSDVEEFRIPLGPFDVGASAQGGSIVSIGDGLLVVEPKGRMDYVSFAGSVSSLNEQVPMNTEALLAWMENSQQAIQLQFYRTLDSLIVEDDRGGQRLLVSHHRFNSERTCVEFVVSEIGVAMGGGAPIFATEGWREVFVANWCVPLPPTVNMYSGHESGGRMVELGPGRILVTTGFFGFDGILMSPAVSQDPHNHFGKILELDLATGRARVFAQGVRNPQGLTVDAQGRIWETEHGPMGGDELNLIRRGSDYGFPSTTFGMQYGSPRRDWPNNSEQGRHDTSFELPRFFFSPSVGTSNLVEAPAQEFPLWRGDLLVASMVGKTLFRVRLQGDNVVAVESIYLGARIRDIIVLPDGALALLMDSEGIRILRRVRQEGETPRAEFPRQFSGYRSLRRVRSTDPSLRRQLGSVEYGRRLFYQQCASCHSLEGAPGMGPTLEGVVGRPIGSAPGFRYSEAMQNARGVWTRERLQDFLADPQSEIPGTTMPDVGPHYHEVYYLLCFLEEEPSCRP